MKASERLRELIAANDGNDLIEVLGALDAIADVVEAAETVSKRSHVPYSGDLARALTALTAALQPPTEGSPPPPEGATAP